MLEIYELIHASAADTLYDHTTDTLTLARIIEIDNDSLLQTAHALGFPKINATELHPPYEITLDQLFRLVLQIGENYEATRGFLLPLLSEDIPIYKSVGYRCDPDAVDSWAPTQIGDQYYIVMEDDKYLWSYLTRWRKRGNRYRLEDVIRKKFRGEKEAGMEYLDTVFYHNGRNYLLWTDSGGDGGSYYFSQSVEEIGEDGTLRLLGRSWTEGRDGNTLEVDVSLEPKGDHLELTPILREQYYDPEAGASSRNIILKTFSIDLDELANLSEPVDLLYYAYHPKEAVREGLIGR